MTQTAPTVPDVWLHSLVAALELLDEAPAPSEAVTAACRRRLLATARLRPDGHAAPASSAAVRIPNRPLARC